MAVPAVVYDYKVLWFFVYICKGPGMYLFRNEGVLQCLEHTVPEESLIQNRRGWKKI
jgi:hypothetical protein